MPVATTRWAHLYQTVGTRFVGAWAGHLIVVQCPLMVRLTERWCRFLPKAPLPSSLNTCLSLAPCPASVPFPEIEVQSNMQPARALSAGTTTNRRSGGLVVARAGASTGIFTSAPANPAKKKTTALQHTQTRAVGGRTYTCPTSPRISCHWQVSFLQIEGGIEQSVGDGTHRGWIR